MLSANAFKTTTLCKYNAAGLKKKKKKAAVWIVQLTLSSQVGSGRYSLRPGNCSCVVCKQTSLLLKEWAVDFLEYLTSHGGFLLANVYAGFLFSEVNSADICTEDEQ